MIVEALFRVVGEVGAELHEERAEVGVDAVEVEVVHHPGRPDDPRIGVAVGVAALLGPQQVRPLLRPADEHHPFGLAGRLEDLQLGMQDVVFALPLDEVDPADLVRLRESVDLCDEPVADRSQRCSRGDRQAEMLLNKADHPAHMLQPQLLHVAVHPVDALNLEHHMISEDISNSARYRHDGLRSDGRPAGQPTAPSGSYTGPARRSRSPRRPEPAHPA
jgi:hypothetical protein